MNEEEKRQTLAKLEKDSARTDVLVGLGAIVLGSLATWIGYAISDGGGTYIIFTGAILWGVVTLFKGLGRMRPGGSTKISEESPTTEAPKPSRVSPEDAAWMSDEKIAAVLSDYKKKFGEGMPSYKEILQMDDVEAMTIWISIRGHKERRKELLEEMITHEEQTGSYLKTLRDEPGDSESAVLGNKIARGLFTREKSEETVRVLEELHETSTKLGYQGADTLKLALYAKALEDWYSMRGK